METTTTSTEATTATGAAAATTTATASATTKAAAATAATEATAAAAAEATTTAAATATATTTTTLLGLALGGKVQTDGAGTTALANVATVLALKGSLGLLDAVEGHVTETLAVARLTGIMLALDVPR